MRKKSKILYVIGSFAAGGAEKSLVSQLNALDPDRFDVYAYVFSNTGLFKDLVPSYVKYVQISPVAEALLHSPFDLKYFCDKPLLLLKKLVRTSTSKCFRGKMDSNQSLWAKWVKDIPFAEGEYDVAVGQQEGIPNYFVIDRVQAQHKILWIHSEYEKLTYSKEFDSEYFEKSHAVVTISEICRQSLCNCFPNLNNIVVLPNISSKNLIEKMALEQVQENYFNTDACRIVSIGRLSYPKHFELAIDAASILNKYDFPFVWIVIGEGPDRKKLQNLVDARGLTSKFLLIGLRSNPYKYLSQADVAVQTSEYEGKSIFADEAKMLGRMFVTTNYDTVSDVVIDRVNGLICEMTAESEASNIRQAYSDIALRQDISENLLKEKIDNVEEIENYYKIYFQPIKKN